MRSALSQVSSPLLQLYLCLPTLVISIFRPRKVFSSNKTIKETFTAVITLQLWSIVTSCLSTSP